MTTYVLITTDPNEPIEAAIAGRAERRVTFEGSFAMSSIWQLDDTYDAESFVIEMNKRLSGDAHTYSRFTSARRHMEAVMEREFKLMQGVMS